MALDPENPRETFYVKFINAIQDQIKAFDYFRGEHSKLDLLLCNMEAIMDKHRQELTVFETRCNSSRNHVDCHQSKKRKLNTTAIIPSHNTTEARPQNFSENKTDDEAEVEAQTPEDHAVFAVELVMLKILRYLPFSDVKLCREVNSYFKLFADQVISNCKLTVVRFTYNWNSKRYVCELIEPNTQNKAVNDLTLSAFTKFFAIRPGFPCKHFSFRYGTLCSPDLQEFLTNCGTRVGELSLEVFQPAWDRENDHSLKNIVNFYPTVSLLKKLLLQQVPNLQTLSLNACPSQWMQNEYFNELFPEKQDEEDIKFPALKVLDVDSTVPDSLIDSLLKVCTNLQSFIGGSFRKNSILPYVRSNKFYLLKNWSFNPHPSKLKLYETINFSLISQLNFLAFTLDIFLEDPTWLPKVSMILQTILQASSATLRQLHFYTPVGLLREFKIPVLPKIKKIQISTADIDQFEAKEYTKKQFPSEFDFGSSLPNLEIVEIQFKTLTGEEKWEDYFDNYTPVLTVKKLSLKYGQIPNKWFQNFASLFPNIHTLKIRTENLHPSLAAQFGLWSFSKLENLIMRIDLEEDWNCSPTLDSAFTGFSEETCLQLQTSYKNFNIHTIDALREFPSILNLKHLKKLHLIFVDNSEEDGLIYPAILTHVAGLFAFQMCSELKVLASGILFKEEKSQALMNALSILSEYVEIEFPFHYI